MCSDLDNDILGEMSEDEAYMLAKETGEAGNEDDDAWFQPTHPKLLSTEYCEDALVRVVRSYSPKMASCRSDLRASNSFLAGSTARRPIFW